MRTLLNQGSVLKYRVVLTTHNTHGPYRQASRPRTYRTTTSLHVAPRPITCSDASPGCSADARASNSVGVTPGPTEPISASACGRWNELGGLRRRRQMQKMRWPGSSTAFADDPSAGLGDRAWRPASSELMSGLKLPWHRRRTTVDAPGAGGLHVGARVAVGQPRSRALLAGTTRMPTSGMRRRCGPMPLSRRGTRAAAG